MACSGPYERLLPLLKFTVIAVGASSIPRDQKAVRAPQVQREGALADSMAVSVLLMQLYIFKFFLCGPQSCQWCCF